MYRSRFPVKPAKEPRFSGEFWLLAGIFGISALPGLLVQIARLAGFHLASFAILALNGFVNFLAMNRDVGGGFNPQPNLVAADIHNGDNNVVANDDAFVTMSRQNQHFRLLPQSRPREVRG